MKDKEPKDCLNVVDINSYKKIETTNKILDVIKKNPGSNVEKIVSLCYLKGIAERATFRTLKHLKNAGRITMKDGDGKVLVNA